MVGRVHSRDRQSSRYYFLCYDLLGVDKCLDAARPVYELPGARDNLQARFPDGAHNFSGFERRAACEFLDKFLKS